MVLASSFLEHLPGTELGDEMTRSGRGRVWAVVLLAIAAVLSASMLAPAFGAPKAVSAASLASKVAKALKLSKKANSNAKKALANSRASGPQGPAGPGGTNGTAGAKGDAGPRGPAGPEGQGSQGPQGDPCLSSDPACRGPEGPEGPEGQGTKGDPCLSSDPACRGPQGPKGDPCLSSDPSCRALRALRAPAGFSDEIVVQKEDTYSPALTTYRIVSCPFSHPKVASGGFSFPTQFAGVATVVEDRPLLSEDGWYVGIRNDGNNQTITAQLFAVCVK
jgi:hypothetical protein